MRTMDILPFPRQAEDLDLNSLFRSRLSQRVVLWPEQALPLLGYMCYPNDNGARDDLLCILRSWPESSEAAAASVPKGLGRIQHDWLRVADIFHIHYDLVEGRHQARRGGPSLGKAITVVEANARAWGTKSSSLWKAWSSYKDVAHLVAAATVICAQARIRYRNKPLWPGGLSWNQFIPFQMAMLMPDLVLAVGLEFQRVGLSAVMHSRTEPVLDPATVWHIPPDIKVVPIPPPIRKIRAEELVVLNHRRAGNRGKANRTTPVFG